MQARTRPARPCTASGAGSWPGAASGLTLPNRDRSCDPAPRAAGFGCVRLRPRVRGTDGSGLAARDNPQEAPKKDEFRRRCQRPTDRGRLRRQIQARLVSCSVVFPGAMGKENGRLKSLSSAQRVDAQAQQSHVECLGLLCHGRKHRALSGGTSTNIRQTSAAVRCPCRAAAQWGGQADRSAQGVGQRQRGAATRGSTCPNGASAPQLQAEDDTLDASDGGPHLGLWRLLVCNLLDVGTQAMPRPGR